jgi:hypothetical protein
MICWATRSFADQLRQESVDRNSGSLMTHANRAKLAILRLLFAITLTFALAKALVLPRKMLRLFHWDKAEHFAAFYVLTALAAAAFPRMSLRTIAIALSSLGAAIELTQALPFIARDSEVWDWAADTLAIAAVLLPLALPGWRSIWHRPSSDWKTGAAPEVPTPGSHTDRTGTT